jgi:hypothetical protein
MLHRVELGIEKKANAIELTPDEITGDVGHLRL